MGRCISAGQPVIDAVASYPNDLTTLPGGQSTPMEGITKNKRKQTLLSLLDALHELSKDDDLDVSGALHCSLVNTGAALNSFASRRTAAQLRSRPRRP